MQIDNMEESKTLLVNLENLFNNLDTVKKQLESKLNIKALVGFKAFMFVSL